MNKREISFYKTVSGKCPVEEFLDSLNDKQVTKVLWVIKLVQELKIVPIEYFKKLKDSEDIWEIRISSGKNNYRLLGFFDDSCFLILTNGFYKKGKKTPVQEIYKAKQRRRDYLKRKNNG